MNREPSTHATWVGGFLFMIAPLAESQAWPVEWHFVPSHAAARTPGGVLEFMKHKIDHQVKVFVEESDGQDGLAVVFAFYGLS